MKLNLNFFLFLALGLTLLSTGCMSLSKVAAELKNDPATIDWEVSTIYGTSRFHRSFPTNWVPPVTPLPKLDKSN